MYNGRAALSCSMNLFPTENYFTAATKRVISSMQSFTKQDAPLMALHGMLNVAPLNYSPLYVSQIFKKYPPLAIEIIV